MNRFDTILLFVNANYDILQLILLFLLVGYLKYLENPIEKSDSVTGFGKAKYEIKDVFLYPSNNSFKFLITANKTSPLYVIISIILMILVMITPLIQLLGIETTY